MALGAVLCLGLPALAHAGGGEAIPASEETPDATTLDAVKVKGAHRLGGTRRGALGDVSEVNTPFSTRSVDQATLEKLQPSSLYGIFSSDASVTRQAGSDYTAWSSYLSIRGLPISSTSGSIKINGLPTNLFGVTLPTEFMEEVRLLKGASGFLYGFAAPGGIVDYITKKPTGQTLLAGDIGWRSDGLLQEHVDLGGHSDQAFGLGYRFNATHQEGNSERGTGVRRDAAALSLSADITPSLRWTADALYQKTHTDRPMPMVFVSTFTGGALPKVQGNWRNPQADNASSDTRFWSVTTGLQWQISPDWSAQFNLGKSANRQVFSVDYLYLYNTAGRFQDRYYDGYYTYAYKTAQLLLQGEFKTGLLDHTLVLGADYQANDNALGASNLFQGYVARGYRYLGSDTASFSYTPVYDASQAVYPTGGDRQKSLFASDTVALGAQWSALLGLRYTDYAKYSNSYTRRGSTVTRTSTRSGNDVTTPTVALLYKPTSSSTLYASYVQALEAGSTVSATYANANQQLDPIQSKQYEVGFKQDGEVWSASAAWFRLDRGTGYANADNVYVQSGISRYQGLDLAASWQIAEPLRLHASAVYLDKADYLNASNAWLIGRQVPGAYRFSAAVGADIRPAVWQGVSIAANARYVGRTTAYQNVTSKITVSTPSYTLYDLSLAYTPQDNPHAWTVRGGVSNLFNKAYWIGGSSSYVFVGDPRTYFVNVSFKY